MQIPNMYGEFAFEGQRLEGNQEVPEVLDSWDQYMSKREIAGIEWVPWVDGPYYLLVINSPAGMVRRFCVFDEERDYRSSICTGMYFIECLYASRVCTKNYANKLYLAMFYTPGMDNRDETATETLYVTKVDEHCNALEFSIVTTKAWTKNPTEIANMFVDEVYGVRTCYGYPENPSDVEDFICDDMDH